MSSTTINDDNSSMDDINYSPQLETAFTTACILAILCIGFGVGTASTLQDFAIARNKPVPVLIGWASQFGFMPVIALVLVKIFQVETAIAVGVVLVGSSPGGSSSNLFTYFAKGDVALSITMSLCSTLGAFLMTPLWTYLLITCALGGGEESNTTVDIPFGNIAIVLLSILIPTGLGLATRHYNTEFKVGGKFLWQRVEQVSTVGGLIFSIASIALGISLNVEIYSKASAPVWFMACLLQPVGSVLGLVAARLLRRTRKEQIAISIETGLQNIFLAIAIVNLSFEGSAKYKGLEFPMVAALMSIFWSPLFTIIYRFGYKSTADEVEGSSSSNSDGKDKELPPVDVENGGVSNVVDDVAEGDTREDSTVSPESVDNDSGDYHA